ncbi:TonB family protein [Vibrio sp. RC27]
MTRLLIAFPLALVVCYSLIGVMAWLVDLNSKPVEKQDEPLAFNIFAADKEQSSERRSRILPDKPEIKPQAPEPEVAPQKVTPTSMATPTLENIPDVKMDFSVSGLSVTAPSLPVSEPVPTADPVASVPVTQPANIGQNQQIMPLHRAEPVYPSKAIQRRIEGYVIVSFDISESGRPINIKVVEEQPKRIFNREAIKALKRWKYQPKMVNGNPIAQHDQKVKLEFKLNK